jgi:hypothetical protein
VVNKIGTNVHFALEFARTRRGANAWKEDSRVTRAAANGSIAMIATSVPSSRGRSFPPAASDARSATKDIEKKKKKNLHWTVTVTIDADNPLSTSPFNSVLLCRLILKKKTGEGEDKEKRFSILKQGKEAPFMAFRRGRVEMMTVAAKKVFSEYADGTQEELMKHSFNYRFSDAIASLRNLLRDWREFTKLYEGKVDYVPQIQQSELLDMYDKKRSQMWTTLLASFRTLALQAVYFEKDRIAARSLVEAFEDMPTPFGMKMPDKMENLMHAAWNLAYGEGMDVYEDLF